MPKPRPLPVLGRCFLKIPVQGLAASPSPLAQTPQLVHCLVLGLGRGAGRWESRQGPLEVQGKVEILVLCHLTGEGGLAAPCTAHQHLSGETGAQGRVHWWLARGLGQGLAFEERHAWKLHLCRSCTVTVSAAQGWCVRGGGVWRGAGGCLRDRWWCGCEGWGGGEGCNRE